MNMLENKNKTTQDQKQKEIWQNKLLPFVKTMLLFFSIFFVVGSSIHIIVLNNKIFDFEEISINEKLSNYEMQSPIDSEITKWLTRAILEEHIVNKRYHQASILLMSRMWLQYLSFLIGLIMVMVGSIFILGRISMAESTFESETKRWGKLLLRSTSPGLFLVLWGTILIVISIVFHHNISVEDVGTYIKSQNSNNTNINIPEISKEEYENSFLNMDSVFVKDSITQPPDETGE